MDSRSLLNRIDRIDTSCPEINSTHPFLEGLVRGWSCFEVTGTRWRNAFRERYRVWGDLWLKIDGESMAVANLNAKRRASGVFAFPRCTALFRRRYAV
jgi:hypothetical protein